MRILASYMNRNIYIWYYAWVDLSTLIYYLTVLLEVSVFCMRMGKRYSKKISALFREAAWCWNYIQESMIVRKPIDGRDYI